MTADDFELDALAVEAAKRVGLRGTITAEYARFRTLKATWERGADFMNIRLSHYLQYAPEAIVMEALVNIIRDALGQKPLRPSEAMATWLAENRHKWTKEAGQ